MADVRGIGRLAGLAVGLSIGVVLVATPGIASAEDMQISVDGFDLLPATGNTAVAESGMGDIAIAIGNDSFACAGCADSPGMFDFAFADGTGSTGGADSGFGNFDTAVANGLGSISDAGLGNSDTAIASGANSFANAEGVSPEALANSDFAYALGGETTAQAGAGIFNAIPSSNDIAFVFDPLGTLGSTALAGDGNFDLAGVLADNLTATAVGNFMVEILPLLGFTG